MRPQLVTSGGRRSLLVHLDQIAAGIGEHRQSDRTRLRRLHGEHDTAFLQAALLGVDVVALERGGRNAVLHQRFLIRTGGRMGVRLEHQLGLIGSLR